MKKISIFLVVAMLFSLMASSGSLVASAEGDFTLNESGDIIGYTGPGGAIVIPAGVKNIWAGFQELAITEVTFEEGSLLEYIHTNAFAYVTTAMTVTLPDKAGITLADYSFFTASTVTMYVPNATTIFTGSNVFWSIGEVNLYGKNASTAEVYSDCQALWNFFDLEYTVDGGYLTEYVGIGGNIVIPKEVTNLYSTVLNDKGITGISFEAGSLLTTFGDGANILFASNPDVIIELPDKEGITVKAWSIWGNSSQITDPNTTTFYEDYSVWTGATFKIIAPEISGAKTFFDNNSAVATGWTFEVGEGGGEEEPPADEFTLNEDGDIVGYTGSGGAIVIPKEVKNIWAGFASKPITNVTFEADSELEYIGSSAFNYVTTDMTIILPDKEGIMIEDWCFYTSSMITITIPNASTVINGDNAFNSLGWVLMYGKNASNAEVYSEKCQYWLFYDLEYTVDGGYLTEYVGDGGEIVIPKEVTNIYSTVLNDKDITKISFEEGSLLTTFGDGANYILAGNPDVIIELPDIEGITIKAWSIWANSSQITAPNATTIFEDYSVYTGIAFKIIAPLISEAKTFYDTNFAGGAIYWTFQRCETIDNQHSFTYSVSAENIISGFGIEQTLAMFLEGVTKGAEVTITALNGETELLATDYIGTGTTIRVDNGIVTVTDYTALVMGDLSGDGAIDINDLVKMKAHLLKIDELSGVNFVAGEFFVQGQISISNLIHLKEYLLGLELIAN